MENAQVAVGRLPPGLVARGHLAAHPPGPPGPRPRSPLTRGRGGAAPCSLLSAPCPCPGSAAAGAIYGYSFILTSLDVSTPSRAAAVEHWYRHRTTIENIFRDSKHGAALRHLPSGYLAVNTAWHARGAARRRAWPPRLHQLTAATRGEEILEGHGTRGGKAMIATLRRRVIAIPARLVRHAGTLILPLPPGHGLLAEILARLRAFPAIPDHPAPHSPGPGTGTREPGAATPGLPPRPLHQKRHPRRSQTTLKIEPSALLADSGLTTELAQPGPPGHRDCLVP